MSERTRCVFCGRANGSYKALAAHLLAEHEGPRLTVETAWGRRSLLLHLRDSNYVQCFCGTACCRRPPSRRTALCRHLRNRGGLAAHLLEVGLGLTV